MFKVLTLNESCQWDEIVNSFTEHDVYYLSGYVKGFYLHGDGTPFLFFYQDNFIKAINVAFKRDISNDSRFSYLEKNKYFDLTTPYGYGGWIIDGEGKLDKLFDEYKKWCKDNSIISEIIRFHPVINNQEYVKDYYNIKKIGNTIAIELNNEEDVWRKFISTKRRNIRKAIKNDVQVKHGLNKELINFFKDIYNQTMIRDNAEEYYYFNDKFYESILNDLKDNCEVFYCLYKDRIIASSLILKEEEKLSYHLSGSLEEYKNLSPTSLLLYETSKWGILNGYKSLHLGGGVGCKEDSLYFFKKAFNREKDLEYYVGGMVFDKDKYDYLVSLRKDKLRDNFFPLYRA